jgi:nucleotide-binding universal stress UspA family protein
MIMMATRGFGPKRRFMIGSTTAKVLHDAPCAVWISPHPCELAPFHAHRNIVIVMNYRKLSAGLLFRASEIADRFGASVSVHSAIPALGTPENALALKLKQEIAATIKSQLAREKLKASIHLIKGDSGEVIGQVATEIAAADLIVIGRGHLDEAAGHLRRHTYEITWNAPCPVITL